MTNKATGHWNKYPLKKGYIELHESLGIDTALHLSLWENIDKHTRVTKDMNGLIIGIVKEKIG